MTGRASLTLRSDGSYTYRGHFNTTPPAVPGITWATNDAWLVIDSVGFAFSFGHSGSVENPFIGSIDTDDWTINGTHPDLAKRWKYMKGAQHFAHSKSDIQLVQTIEGLIAEAKAVVGVIEEVVAVVGPVVALVA